MNSANELLNLVASIGSATARVSSGESKAKPKTKPSEISLLSLGRHLFKANKDLRSSANEITKTALDLLASWQDTFEEINTLVKDLGTDINEMAEDKEDKGSQETLKSAWEKFRIQLKNLTGKVKDLSEAIKSTNEEEIVKKSVLFMKQLPDLLQTFHGLGLNAKLKSLLPSSFQEFKNNINGFVRESFKSFFPKDDHTLHNQFHKFLRNGSIEFKGLSEDSFGLQAFELLCMEQLNEILKNFYLKIDELENQLSLKEGSLLGKKFEFLQGYDLCLMVKEEKEMEEGKIYAEIKDNKIHYKLKYDGEVKTGIVSQKENFKNSENFLKQLQQYFSVILADAGKKEHIHLNSIAKTAENFSKLYMSCMEKAGYSLDQVEVYPYNSSKIKKKQEFIKNLGDEFRSSKEQREKKQKETLDEVDKKSIEKLQDKARELLKSKNPEDSKFAQYVLDIKNHIGLDFEVSQMNKQAKESKKLLEPYNEIISIQKSIIESLKKSHKEENSSKLSAFNSKKKSMEESLKKISKDVSKNLDQKYNLISEAQPRKTAQDVLNHIVHNLPRKKEKIKKLISHLTDENHPQDEKQNNNESKLKSVHNFILDIEKKIEKVVDEKSYDKYFTKKESDNSLLSNAASSLRDITEIVTFVEKVISGEGHKKTDPASSLMALDTQLDETLELTVDLVQKIQKIKSDPFVKKLTAVEDHKNIISKMISENLMPLFPESDKGFLDECQEWLVCDEKTAVESFSKKPPLMKDSQLFFMSAFNEGLKNIFLKIREIEKQFHLKKDLFLNEKFEFPANRNSTAVGNSSLEIKKTEHTLGEVFTQFSSLYKAYMENTGYTVGDAYPYESVAEQKSTLQPNNFFKNLKEILDKISKSEKNITSSLNSLFPSEEKRNPLEDAKKFVKKIETALQEVMDEKAYSDYFVEKKHVNTAPKLWIAKVGGSFKDIKSLIGSIESVVFTESQDKKGSPGASLANRAKTLEQASEEAKNLVEKINELKEDKFIKQIVEYKEFYKSTTQPFTDKYYFPKDKFFNEELISKEENKAHSSHRINPAEPAIQVVRNIYNNLMEHLPQDKVTDKNTKEFLKKAHYIIKHFPLGPDGIQPVSIAKVIWFINKNLFSILYAIGDAETSVYSLINGSESLSMQCICDINELLRDLSKLTENLEETFYLKKGLISNTKLEGYSLSSITQEFYKKISQLGYEFNESDKVSFPVLSNNQLLSERKSESKEYSDSEVNSQKTKEDFKKLNELVKNRFLLEIEKCRQERNNNYYFFYHSGKRKLEQKHYALKTLLNLIEKSNCDVVKGMMILSSQDRLAYNTLQNDHTALMSELKKFEDTRMAGLGLEANDRKINLSFYNRNPVFYKSGTSVMEDKKEYPMNKGAQCLITNRLNQLNKEWSTSIRRTKIQLLGELHKKLDDHSLENALCNIQKDLKFKDSFYLLFEGRTGEMMREIQLANLSKEDMQARIQAEIDKLSEKKDAGFYFFSNHRTANIQKRIDALQDLKDKINDGDSVNFEKIMEKVDSTNKDILYANETQLIADLRLWKSNKISNIRVG